MLQQTDEDCSFTSAIWLFTLMWNDFFLDAATNLRKIYIVLYGAPFVNILFLTYLAQ